MGQMTWFLVSDGSLNLIGRRNDWPFGQELGHVPDPRTEGLGTVGIDRILVQKVAIFLQRCTATSSGDHDLLTA